MEYDYSAKADYYCVCNQFEKYLQSLIFVLKIPSNFNDGLPFLTAISGHSLRNAIQ